MEQRHFQRRLPIGAEVAGSRVDFRVWAPKREKVAVVIGSNGRQPSEHVLTPEEGGYFSAVVECDPQNLSYLFRLDDGERLFPDPASRFQPEGPDGASQVISPDSFEWTDDEWQGLKQDGQVIYEMHVGTFTHEGTWNSALRELESLAQLGITCLEVMPIAQFPGRFDWGYDGVGLFAPASQYGRPEHLRAFIDAAHNIGLGVILDLVCNHVGSDGNYFSEFSDSFFGTKDGTDWGDAINFGGAGCAGVREFYLANARYWISEYHLDGFRFDATQNIYDSSSPHILAEISMAARQAAAGRSILLICESEPQESKIARSREMGGYGMDALWNDDFHHCAFVALSGRAQAFYEDYQGTPQELISAAKWGYLYQGQTYRWQGKRRGHNASDLPPCAFVNYLQNHDQIANFGHGLRLHQSVHPAELRALTALLLLAPQTPLLFQGQEYGATQKFNFFADSRPDIAPAVRLGRARELGQFLSVSQPEMIEVLPDPTSVETFMGCKLDRLERLGQAHAPVLALHQDLLNIRRTDVVLRAAQVERRVDGAVLSAHAFVLRFRGQNEDDRLLLVNLGPDQRPQMMPEPLMAPPTGKRWRVLWSSEDPKYGGTGTVEVERLAAEEASFPQHYWLIPGKAAVLLDPVDLTPQELAIEHQRALELERLKKEHQSRIKCHG